jgi:hypothetical protein
MDRADRVAQYAGTRTDRELRQAHTELERAQRQAPAGGLAALLIARYSRAVAAESGIRAWESQ